MKPTALVYVLSLALFSIFSYLYIDSNFAHLNNLPGGINWSYPGEVTLGYLVIISLFFASYLILVSKYKTIKLNKWITLIFIFPILAYPAMLSYDIFNYIATSKVLYLYLENPYIIMPIEFLNDPVLLFTQAVNKVALYGPLWLVLSGIPYALSFGNYFGIILGFKLLTGVFYAGILYLIWKITKNNFSVFLFGASPLVIIETFVSGHNDVAMMFFALTSFYLLKQKKIYLAIGLLTLSILIKYATIALIPIFILTAYKIIRRINVDWKKVYFYGFLSMMAIFFLSFFREEIYPWYAIWPFIFLVLISEKRKYVYFFIALTFGLMLSYMPYMYSGSYFGMSRVLRVTLIFIPPILLGVYWFFLNKLKLSK